MFHQNLLSLLTLPFPLYNMGIIHIISPIQDGIIQRAIKSSQKFLEEMRRVSEEMILNTPSSVPK